MCACARACVCWVGCSPHSSEAERQKGQWPHFTRGASGGMQSRVIDSGGEEAQPAGQPWFWQVDLTGEATLTSRPTLSNHQDCVSGDQTAQSRCCAWIVLGQHETLVGTEAEKNKFAQEFV